MIRKILLPFVISALLAYILNPIISYVEAYGIKRAIVVILFYILAITVIVVLLNVLVPLLITEIIKFKAKLPLYIRQINAYIVLAKNYILNLPILNQQKGLAILTEEIVPKITSFLTTNLSKAPKHLFGVISTVTLLLMIPFISFFMLLKGKKFIAATFNLIPSKYVETSLSLICEIDQVLGKYIRGQLLDALCVGILATVGLLILKVDHAPLLGALAGIGNLIPYLGPIVGGVPAAILTLLKTKSLISVTQVIVMFMFIQFIDNNFIAPFIVGNTVKLHPVAILFALLVGGQFFGPLGMLFAVPVLCIVKITFTILFRHFYRYSESNFN